MRILKKSCLVATAAAVMTGLISSTALASSKDKITSVRLTITDRLVPGEEVSEDSVEITASSDKYDVSDWEFEDSGFTWEDGDVPRIVVTLETDEDHSFSVSKDDVKLKGDAATVYKTKKEDKQTLLVTIDLEPVSSRIGGIEYAYLDGRTATWAPSSGATGYELYLYRDGSVVGSKKTTEETTYNFGSAMVKEGAYYYRVRGTGDNGAKAGQYTQSGEYQYQGGSAQTGQSNETQNSQETGQVNNDGTAVQGQWVQDEIGWWWKNPDGTWPANKWEEINGKWYLFQESGYRASGWIIWNNKIYFLGSDGALWIDCQTPDGYTVGADGALVQ